MADLENRCPHGKKTILYKKAKLEKFAEYLNQDGLVTKLTIYNDSASKELWRMQWDTWIPLCR